MRPTVVLVGGGKGGVGKSTIAAGLARHLVARGTAVGVLDADIASPSQALILGCRSSTRTGLTGISPDDVRLASVGLVARADSSLVWSDVTASAAIRQLAEAAGEFKADVLLVDLPPGHGQVATDIVRTFPSAHGLLVTTGSVLALEQCRRAGTFLRRMEVPILGIVENMAVVQCPACGDRAPLFDPNGAERLAQDLDLPVLARLAAGPSAEAGDGFDDVAARVMAMVNQTERSADHVR
jgi:ATP-binding protein involved in chromosome partitioning